MTPTAGGRSGGIVGSLRRLLRGLGSRGTGGDPERILRRKASLTRWGFILGVVVVWQIAASLEWLDPLFIASPTRVAAAAVGLAGDPEWWASFGQTLLELMAGFVVGTSAGIAFAVLVSMSRPLRDAYLGPVVFLLSVPKSVFVPFFIVAFGLGVVSAAAFGAFSAFFYVAVNLVGGIDLVEERHKEIARAFGANRRFVFTDVTLPASLPGLFAALWQGVNHGFGGVLIAELWASRGGIGEQIKLYSSLFRAGEVLAITLTVAILAILLGTVWANLELKFDWRRTEGAATTQRLSDQ